MCGLQLEESTEIRGSDGSCIQSDSLGGHGAAQGWSASNVDVSQASGSISPNAHVIRGSQDAPAHPSIDLTTSPVAAEVHVDLPKKVSSSLSLSAVFPVFCFGIPFTATASTSSLHLV